MELRTFLVSARQALHHQPYRQPLRCFECTPVISIFGDFPTPSPKRSYFPHVLSRKRDLLRILRASETAPGVLLHEESDRHGVRIDWSGPTHTPVLSAVSVTKILT